VAKKARRTNLGTSKRLGFRSGLEEKIAKQLQEAGVKVEYETTKIRYIVPESLHTYTVDFVLPNGIMIETKGRLVVADRKKHILIKEQHPELDIRFVFQNSKNPIRKGSKTTYADWATKHGFKYADKEIPDEWLKS
jgi:hypothetical protein